MSFSVDPADLLDVLAPAGALAVVGVAGKLLSGWVAARRSAAARGRLRAGTVLIARGEFSVVIAALGAATTDGAELGAMTAAYVLITAVAGPLTTKFADRIPANRWRTARPRAHLSGRGAGQGERKSVDRPGPRAKVPVLVDDSDGR